MRALLSSEARKEITTAINEVLFAKRRENLVLELGEIILDNSAHHGNTNRSFHWKGEFFGYLEANGKPPKIQNPLHPIMRERLKAHIETRKMLEDDQSMATAYMNCIYSVTGNREDIRKLLPPTLQTALLFRVPSHLFLNTPAMSDAEIADFKEQNQYCLSLMQARIALNLIAPK